MTRFDTAVKVIRRRYPDMDEAEIHRHALEIAVRIGLKAVDKMGIQEKEQEPSFHNKKANVVPYKWGSGYSR